MNQTHFELISIGHIEVDERRGLYRLHILPKYRPALKGLDSCTHAIVMWWADQLDNPGGRDGDLIVDLPYAPGVQAGLFATRSQARPNPVAITNVYLLKVDEEDGTVDLPWIDAFDGTPILDIKPYLPMSDRIMGADYPEWLKGFPDSMEEAADFFANPENLAKFS
ncbi:MAG: TrmO family methyltransferase [Ardenticatenaceae bacterium]|nr:TrmO family methyltransferase [Ardenticatenaceae bacterium]